jgi:hypothetical protein
VSHGYDGNGSGGAVRIIAGSLSGSGSIVATGETNGKSGGDGRIRLETLSGGADLKPAPSTPIEPPSDPVMIWPPDTAPSVRVISIGSYNVPADPQSSLGPAPPDLRFFSAAPLTATIETKNVETANAKVTLRVTPKHGAAFMVDATYVSGNTQTALWTAHVSVPQGFSAMQPRVDPK